MPTLKGCDAEDSDSQHLDSTSFRARLDELAVAYAKLQAHCQMLQAANSIDAKGGEQLPRKDVHGVASVRLPLRGHQPPCAPGFDDTTCDDVVVDSDWMLSQILNNADTSTDLASTDENGQIEQNGHSSEPKSPATHNSRRGREKLRQSFADRTSSIGRKSVSDSLHRIGFEARRRCLVGLGLVSVDDVEEVSPTDKDDSRADEWTEQIQSWWETYSRIDSDGVGVTADTLDKFGAQLSGQTAAAGRCARFEEVISAFNDFVVSVHGDGCDCPDQNRLSFHAFVELVCMEHLESSFDQSVCNHIIEIRTMLAHEHATRVVACLSHVDRDKILAPAFDMTVIYFDGFVCILIILNALVIGFSTDHFTEWFGWTVVECLFLFFFTGEIVYKVKKSGCRSHWWGEDRYWNVFDLSILLIAIVDVMFYFIGEFQFGNVTLLRLLRIVRVLRVLRILRMRAFKELTLMIQGVFAGLRTLFWASVILAFVIFCLGMILRQTVGQPVDSCSRRLAGQSQSFNDTCGRIEKYREVHFSTVARCMFTTLRCFTGDCETTDGTPLTLHLWEAYGWPILLAYVICFLFVTFGLFNLIVAIFVENTIESARFNEQKRQNAKAFENVRTARALHNLMMRFATESEREQAEWQGGAERVSTNVTNEIFRRVVAQPDTERLLEDLGIYVSNADDIFEALDADASGSLDIKELSNGFLKMRGTANKSDAVAMLLKVNTVLKRVAKFETRVMTVLSGISPALAANIANCDMDMSGW